PSVATYEDDKAVCQMILDARALKVYAHQSMIVYVLEYLILVNFRLHSSKSKFLTIKKRVVAFIIVPQLWDSLLLLVFPYLILLLPFGDLKPKSKILSFLILFPDAIKVPTMIRNPLLTQDHVLAERKRREKLN
nr:hypothetical protein [Tanacetum cinerariifolium]